MLSCLIHVYIIISYSNVTTLQTNQTSYLRTQTITITTTLNKCIADDTKAAACRSPNCIRKKNGEERFTTWLLEFSFHFRFWL